MPGPKEAMKKFLSLALYAGLALGLLAASGCVKKINEPTRFEYVYQVGSFKDKDNALNLKQELEKQGYTVDITEVMVQGDHFNRVLVKHNGPIQFQWQVGAFSKRENADKLQQELVQRGYEAVVKTVVLEGVVYHRVLVYHEDSLEEFLSVLNAMGLDKPMIRSIKSL